VAFAKVGCQPKGGISMNGTHRGHRQSDEDVVTYEVSDETLEAAADPAATTFPFSLPPCHPRFLLIGGTRGRTVQGHG
jgi:hypothetical protein